MYPCQFISWCYFIARETEAQSSDLSRVTQAEWPDTSLKPRQAGSRVLALTHSLSAQCSAGQSQQLLGAWLPGAGKALGGKLGKLRPIKEMATSGGLIHFKHRCWTGPERGMGADVTADPHLAPFPGLASTSRPLPTAPPLFTDQSRKHSMTNAPLGPRWAS